MDTIIVFSHLRWDFVYQRPQHLLSRVAARWRVIVVEEPVAGDGQFEVSTPAPGVTVLRPRTRPSEQGFADAQFEPIGALLREYLEQEQIRRYGLWLYTPMALPLLGELAPETIIYDCMDELSAFKNAPAQLIARENTLLQIANVVFTGGPSLYDAKRERNANVHCLPSSVDEPHFARAADPQIASSVFAKVPYPRLGFFGVIDERLDIELIARLADAKLDWQVCLAGPIVKIDPETLPKRPNLHYLPQQAYEDLPSLLAAWNVCLLPFALNESTRFISPTKTLEYMCARKPIVSTEIRDVRRLYADGVSLAANADAFIDACHDALMESTPRRNERIAAQDRLVGATSWDRTAQEVIRQIEATLPQGLSSQARDYLAQRQVVQLPLKPAVRGEGDRHVQTLILGAGPTGLSAAYHYGTGSLTIDANDRVGGWCRSIEDNGFTFDHAGHIMFSKDPYVLGLYEKLLGDNLHWQDREAWVYSKGVHTRYPFQGALYGLPPDVLKECIVGAIEARFGTLATASEKPGPSLPVAGSVPAPRATSCRSDDCCADGGLPEMPGEGDVKDQGPSVRGISARRASPRNFEEFIYQVWGAGVAKHFAVPYNLKLWTVPLREMETSWLGGRVPLPDLEEMIDGALRPVAKPVGPNARFGYPLKGGFQALMDGFLPHLTGDLELSTRLVALHPNMRVAQLHDGRRIGYDTLISTIPLPELVRKSGDEVPEHVKKAAAALRHVSVRCVNLGIARCNVTDKHWIYYPEETIFHRIFVQGNASAANNPEGGFGLTCEITYSPSKPLPCDGEALIQRCIDECRQVGMLRDEDEILTANLVDMPYAYVIYDHARADNVARIRTWFATKGILLAGRYSEWEYYNSDHAFIAGKRVAESVLQASATGTQGIR
jgi:protoporphyrinogen oxidase